MPKKRISIHAARVGCDYDKHARQLSNCRYFNPRSPSGLRLSLAGVSGFTSTISIHAARVGCDCKIIRTADVVNNFNPRSPSGLRQVCAFDENDCWGISIHAARVGCDGVLDLLVMC